MSEQIPEPGTGEENETNEPQNDEVDIAALIAERDKWKSLSRKHEDQWKNTSKELDEIKKASLTDSERALAEAAERAKQEAYAEVGSRLAAAELRAAAASQGVEIPDSVTQFLDVTRFIGGDGSPDEAAISTFVASLAPKRPAFPQNAGIGPQGGSGTARLTREDLSRMTHAQVNEALENGRLNHLLLGES